MPLKLAISVLLLLLSGCTLKNGNTYEIEISHQIDSAERTSSDLGQRLQHALIADSIACVLSAQRYELTTAKLVATIYLKKGNMSAARNYLYKAVVLARKKHDYEALGITLNNLALSYSEQAELDSALYYYNQARIVFQKTGDQLRLAQGKINVGVVYKKRGEYQIAFDTTVQAIPALQLIGGPKDIAVAYTTIANILKELKRFPDALKYHEMALKLRELTK
jgi:tetratricopeptide (TPR) repeat protein